MRKALAIFVAVLVLVTGGGIALGLDAHSAYDQVTLTPETCYGDGAAAEGLSFRLKANYVNQVFWETTGSFDRLDGLQTDFSYYNHPVSEAAEPYNELTLSTTLDNDLSYQGDTVLGSSPLRAAYQELADQMSPGETRTAVIHLADYVAYYPITLDISIQRDGKSWWYYGWSGMEEGEVVPGSGRYIEQKLSEYFKIPVLEEETWLIILAKNANGDICALGGGNAANGFSVSHDGSLDESVGGEIDVYLEAAEQGDAYCPYTWGVAGPDGFYFTISPITYNGNQVDLSQLPDGCGVFFLPYGTYESKSGSFTSVDAESLDLIYPLNPDTELLDMTVNERENQLLLHTLEDGKYVLTVISLDTMTTLQRLTVADYDWGLTLFPQWEDNLLVAQVDNQWVVLTIEDGTYVLALCCPVEPEGLSDSPFQMMDWNYTFAFDGSRLAVGGFCREWAEGYTVTSCGVNLCVYDDTGLIYWGRYLNSLGSSRYQEDNDYCEGELTLRWER